MSPFRHRPSTTRVRRQTGIDAKVVPAMTLDPSDRFLEGRRQRTRDQVDHLQRAHADDRAPSIIYDTGDPADFKLHLLQRACPDAGQGSRRRRPTTLTTPTRRTRSTSCGPTSARTATSSSASRRSRRIAAPGWPAVSSFQPAGSGRASLAGRTCSSPSTRSTTPWGSGSPCPTTWCTSARRARSARPPSPRRRGSPSPLRLPLLNRHRGRTTPPARAVASGCGSSTPAGTTQEGRAPQGHALAPQDRCHGRSRTGRYPRPGRAPTGVRRSRHLRRGSGPRDGVKVHNPGAQPCR